MEYLLDGAGGEGLVGVKVLFQPGLVTAFAVLDQKVPEKREVDALRLISLIDNSIENGTVMLREPWPAEVSVRASVQYSQADSLATPCLEAMMTDVLVFAELIGPPIEAVIEGGGLDEAFDRL